MNGFQQRKLVVVIILVFLLTSTSCVSKKEPIQIGVVGTMTGTNSDLSISGRRGIELATLEINQAGGINGRMIELVIKDDQNNPIIAKKTDEAFVSEGIETVIGHFTSGMMVGNIDYIQKQKILYLGSTISADEFSNKDDNFIRFIASTKEQATALANLAKRNNQTSFVVIYDEKNKGFNQSLANNFRDKVEKNGGGVIFESSFNVDQFEATVDLVSKVSKLPAQGIFVIAGAESNAKIAQLLKGNQSHLQIYAPLWANTAELIRKGGTAVDGLYVLGGINIDSRQASYVAFKNSFESRFGEAPTFASMYAYETAQALFDAIKKANSTEPIKVKAAILKTKDYKGVQSDYSIDAYGDNTRQYMVFRVMNGRLTKID